MWEQTGVSGHVFRMKSTILGERRERGGRLGDAFLGDPLVPCLNPCRPWLKQGPAHVSVFSLSSQCDIPPGTRGSYCYFYLGF